jgi:hypothetical protein
MESDASAPSRLAIMPCRRYQEGAARTPGTRVELHQMRHKDPMTVLKTAFHVRVEIGGRSVVVRFEWLVADLAEPRWQQSFSYDGGDRWKLNWEMRLTRAQ